ncbi:MAG: HAMP domain-containing histidine kinase [Clostridia bacterium]|nr:HAMP domain-containing histidine kinase [Clostridia bacterium]MBO4428726.1 HAMP domain-containing histidine kinase [Clostridia bacterium]
MFNKTRRKIVFTVVFSLLALMIVTLSTIYFSNRIALQRKNEEMLKMYAERYSLEEMPFGPDDGMPDGMFDDRPGDQGGKPGPHDGDFGKNEPQFQLSTFYAVAYSSDGEVLSVNNGNNALQSEESLLKITDSIIESGKTSGKTGNMTYLVERRDGYTLVAMIDGTINDDNQTILIKQMLIIGGAALAVLVVISIFLAGWIVKPLEENDKRQKLFVSDAGHELKTPIAVISANSELLRRQIGENEWLLNIDYENERMSDLVKQLLALSKAESGGVPKETVDFSKLVDGEALPFETLAFEKGKKINSEVEQGIAVKGAPNQLRQLVSILLDNAVSHGTGNEINLTLKREKHSAVLTVSNEAEEMSAEQLSHLFDRFYRTDEARNESGSHYGLGLSIAKAAVDAHGGNIRAEYKDGKAIFTVFIPIEKN